MEPSYFYYIAMPLGILIVVLVALVIYTARNDNDDNSEVKKLRMLMISGKLDKKTFVRLRNRIKHEEHFNNESKKLLSLLSDEKIDETTYVRLRQILEMSFRDRLDKLNEREINRV